MSRIKEAFGAITIIGSPDQIKQGNVLMRPSTVLPQGELSLRRIGGGASLRNPHNRVEGASGFQAGS
jgi:hypothetical protein